MICLHPVSVGGVLFRCGRCASCKRQNSLNWTQRIIRELKYWNYKYFITLTYNNDNLPDELIKKDLQLFIKRIRKYYELKLLYYGVGEYGSKMGRPHYHIIMLTDKELDNEKVEDEWRLGFVKLGDVNIKSIKYVTNYIIDKNKGTYQNKFNAVIQPPFMVCSKGIGLRWLKENEEEVIKDMTLKQNGKPVGLPRYYLNKIKDKISDDVLNKKAIERFENDMMKYEEMNVKDIDIAIYKKQLRRRKECEIKHFEEKRKSKLKL